MATQVWRSLCGHLLSLIGELPEPLRRPRSWGKSGTVARRKRLKKAEINFYPFCLWSFWRIFTGSHRLLLAFFSQMICSSESRRRRQRNKENKQHTARILWVVLKGEMEAPRMLAVPSSIPWSNPLLCCWRPEDDESTSGLRNLKVRSGPSTTIESLTKSFLKEKLVERLAPIVPCNWAVVVCETK